MVERTGYHKLFFNFHTCPTVHPPHIKIKKYLKRDLGFHGLQRQLEACWGPCLLSQGVSLAVGLSTTLACPGAGTVTTLGHPCLLRPAQSSQPCRGHQAPSSRPTRYLLAASNHTAAEVAARFGVDHGRYIFLALQVCEVEFSPLSLLPVGWGASHLLLSVWGWLGGGEGNRAWGGERHEEPEAP